MKTTAAYNRARAAAKSGYSVSELIDLPGVFIIRKPSGVCYEVRTGAVSTCTCPATVPYCKHVELARICQRYVQALDRRVAAASIEAGYQIRLARVRALILQDY